MHTMTEDVVCLSCYVYIFAIGTYLTTAKWLFFSKNYVSLERSPFDEDDILSLTVALIL